MAASIQKSAGLSAAGAAMTTAFDRPLLDPLTLGALKLRHRIVLVGAPSGVGVGADGAPDSSLSAYFGELATPGGLLICAAAPAGAASRGDSDPIPGIHSTPQVNAWRSVTEAIHARGGLAIVQLGDAAKDVLALPDLDGIDAALMAYRAATENAADAGFDGVELLCTRGTLADRLMARFDRLTSTPRGIDPGCDQNFALDALQAVLGNWAASTLGVCLSLPEDAAEVALACALLASAKALGFAYAHLVPPAGGKAPALGTMDPALRAAAPEKVIVSGDWTPTAAAAAIEAREVDAVGVEGLNFRAMRELLRSSALDFGDADSAQWREKR